LPPDMQAPVVGVTASGVPGAAGTTLAIPRLGIPAIVVADGPAGLRIQPTRKGEEGRTYYCTAFPVATALASSWDLDLVERVGRAMGNEVREYGVDVLLGPALNIHRNPLGGRNFEYYSEDPLVAGRMAAAMVRGVQSQGVGTAIKHYAANNHEWNRDTIDVKVSARALRDDWKFDGLVMTDWFGGKDPVAQMTAGNELLMPGTGRQRRELLAALESGALKEDVLDRNVERVLALVLRTPAFHHAAHGDHPDLKAHAEEARQAAAEGMVLLRNQGALPLKAPAKLALFGNSAYSTITGGTGSGDVNEAYVVSLAQGLKDAGFVVDGALADAYPPYIKEAEGKRPPMPMPFLLPPPIAEMTVRAEEI